MAKTAYPPPPTKFGASYVQAKAAATTRTSFPPPPTKFGLGYVQAKAAAPGRVAFPPPPTKFGPGHVQAKTAAPVRAAFPPPPTKFGPGHVQAKATPSARLTDPPVAPGAGAMPGPQSAAGPWRSTGQRAAVALRPIQRPAFAPRAAKAVVAVPISTLGIASERRAVQPALIAGLAIGAAAAIYGAYRYYRHRDRENVIGQVRQEQAALAPFINQSTQTHGGIGTTSTATTLNNAVAKPFRQYDVYVNLDDPVGSGTTSPALIESATIHEFTHVAADQGYSANVPGTSQYTFNTQGQFQLDPTYQGYPAVDRAEKLLIAIAGDNALTRTQRAHLRERVRGNSVKPMEWDSTVNELLVYTQRSGIRANSRTVKLLVRYARENLAHRRGTLVDLPRLTRIGGNPYHTQTNWRHF